VAWAILVFMSILWAFIPANLWFASCFLLFWKFRALMTPIFYCWDLPICRTRFFINSPAVFNHVPTLLSFFCFYCASLSVFWITSFVLFFSSSRPLRFCSSFPRVSVTFVFSVFFAAKLFSPFLIASAKLAIFLPQVLRP